MAGLPGILLLGINHKTASLDLREKLSLNAEELENLLFKLKQTAALSEIMVLSTCNRVEFLLVSEDMEAAKKSLFDELKRKRGLSEDFFSSFFYSYDGLNAVRHLFRVSSSLDSMVLGEPQILGQVKQAYQRSTAMGASGPVLNRLLHRAFQLAKRVRSETGIGDNAVSISYAAIELAKKIFGSMENCKVLLLGAGEMAELAVEHLLRQKIAGVFVANRTFERGLDLARRFGGEALRFEDAFSVMEEVDIVISSTGAPDYVILKKDIKPLMKKRQNRFLFFIDIAVPRDIDPAINKLDNAYLYDIDDLQNVIDENMEERRQEAFRAEAFVEEAVLRFSEWIENLALVPTIKALRDKLEGILEEELFRTLGNHPPCFEAGAVERMLDAMVTKVMHDPIKLLKSGGMRGKREPYLAWVRLLFDLDSSLSSSSLPEREKKSL